MGTMPSVTNRSSNSLEVQIDKASGSSLVTTAANRTLACRALFRRIKLICSLTSAWRLLRAAEMTDESLVASVFSLVSLAT